MCQTSKPQSHIWGFSYKVDFLNVGYSRTAEKHSVLVITNPLNSCTLSYKAVSACTRPAQDQANPNSSTHRWTGVHETLVEELLVISCIWGRDSQFSSGVLHQVGFTCYREWTYTPPHTSNTPELSWLLGKKF